MAANSVLLAELNRIEAMPPKQQIAGLQTLSRQTMGRRLHDSVVARLERAQDLAAEQDDAARRTAEADAAAQRLAETQQAIEQGRREAVARRAEIDRERAVLAEQSRRTEAAQQDTEAARQRLAQLNQQQQTLAPSQAQLDQQRERDEAKLRQLRQQRTTLEAQAKAAQQQDRMNELLHNLISENGDRLASLRFSGSMLNSTIMFWNGQSYSSFSTFRQFMSVLLSCRDLTINDITAYGGTRRGFSYKGLIGPTTSVVFRQDGNELYIEAWGRGDSMQKPTEIEAMMYVQLLQILFMDGLDQAARASPGNQHTP